MYLRHPLVIHVIYLNYSVYCFGVLYHTLPEYTQIVDV